MAGSSTESNGTPANHPEGASGMLFNLQILRGIAAVGVAFYHTDFRLAGNHHTEFFGVSTFFVISGFIMCWNGLIMIYTFF